MMRTLAVATLLATLSLSGCAAEGLRNQNFHEWCDELPCGWKLDEGTVKKTATWHREDHGVELAAGTPAQLSQLWGGMLASCVRVDIVATSEPNAGLALHLDFDDDGSIDYTEPLSASDWRSHTFRLKPPLGYESVRYVLRKTGPAQATIAKLSASVDHDCYGEPILLEQGAACGTDVSCKSGRCLDGRCSGCSRGQCGESDACSEDSDCLNGGCAGGHCRACALAESCLPREPCSASSQCARGLCVAGSLPNLISSPENEGVCAECGSDADCPKGRCSLGFCGECASDEDCPAELACRYRDLYEASERACLPRIVAKRSRGQLCERDDDCEPDLRCGAGPGRAKRCGVACASDGDCGGEGVCARPGARKLASSAERVTLPSFTLATERIATCYPLSGSAQSCAVHEQCLPFAMSCCSGGCIDLRVDRTTGVCGSEPPNR